jgi:hypothetical protein
MSDPHAHAPAHAASGGGKATIGSKLGKALGVILLVALFFMILPSLISMLSSGASSSVGAIANGFGSLGGSFTAAEQGFKVMTRALLSFVITLIVFAALGALAFKIFKMIIAYAKGQ